MKYRRDMGLGDALASQIIMFLRQLSWSADMVVPVPLGKHRRGERGYNQVGLIAYPLALLMDWDYNPRALFRTRETTTQVGLSVVARRSNVMDAFQAIPKLIQGKQIILIDDVATTGATLSSCARALMNAGALGVKAITVARALSYRSDS
ncbi:MAG: ComF family protein [Anaerolineales bacterium]|nr:ComF family protein [Anaerolineales bacterium]